MIESPLPRLSIRSYVLGRGRITVAQNRAWQSLASRYVVAAAESPPDWSLQFRRCAPLVAEIGSGYGEALSEVAVAAPQRNYVAFEVHRPGVGALMNRLQAARAENVRIVCADAMSFLPLMFANGALAGVNVFFPDPWPKARHQKRRLLRPSFVVALSAKLATGGVLHVATDWRDYAAAIAETFAAAPQFAAMASPPRPPTAYERRGVAAGRASVDLCYRRL